MSGLFGGLNYENAGPGVPKNAPKKKRFFLFFDILVRKFWRIMKLNLIFLLFCIPIVTIGPAIAGVTKVLRNFTLEKHADVWGDFFGSFKKNFKNSIIVGIADTLIATSLVTSSIVYPQIAENSDNNLFMAIYGITIAVGIVVMMMNFYIFPMIVSTDLSLKDIVKNSFALTFMGIKPCLIAIAFSLLLVVALCALIYFTTSYLVIFLLFAPAIIGFIVCFNCYPIVQKYVTNPYYEKIGQPNPEENLLDDTDNNAGNKIFTDKGGSEKSFKKKNSKKGRTIS